MTPNGPPPGRSKKRRRQPGRIFGRVGETIPRRQRQEKRGVEGSRRGRTYKSILRRRRPTLEGPSEIQD